MIDESPDVRTRILRAAIELLASGGRDAVSTRAVSAAAGVQAPTIYRQFGDMKGLMDAMARELLQEYVLKKATLEASHDPVDDLRRGWAEHVAFGVSNPAAYLLIYGDPPTVPDTPAKRRAEELLLALVGRVAESGRLRVTVSLGAHMMAAACRGVTLAHIGSPPEERDLRLSEATCTAVLDAITVPALPDSIDRSSNNVHRVAARAVALRAVLDDAPEVLSAAEQQLMSEWLDRLASAS